MSGKSQPATETTIAKLHQARHLIQMACEMLIEIPDPKPGTDEWDLVLPARADIFPGSTAGVKGPSA